MGIAMMEADDGLSGAGVVSDEQELKPDAILFHIAPDGRAVSHRASRSNECDTCRLIAGAEERARVAEARAEILKDELSRLRAAIDGNATALDLITTCLRDGRAPLEGQ